MNQNKIYQQENDELLNFLLEKRFFELWSEEEFSKNKYNFSDGAQLELFITNTCNQKCEYCYLYDNEELYPKNVNNPELILNNLNILCNWFIENNYHISTIKLFSGEIWHTNFGLQILDTLYQAAKNGLKYNYISIPSNCSFATDYKILTKIQKYIDLFSSINIRLEFSISIDGAIVDNSSRAFKNSDVLKTENYYDKIFSFAIHNGYGFHPMVSAQNVKYWVENWEWWKKITNQYGYNFPFQAIMMLEVRNDDWTQESIKTYCNFLQVLFKDALEIEYNNDSKKMAYSLLGFGSGLNHYSYVPCILSLGLTVPSCSIGDTLTIRLGDLSICPCHRLATNKNLYGKFNIENNKITNIISNNVSQAVRILMGNNTLLSPKCTNCIYNEVCLKGCFGSQYETNNDPFLPIECICDLMQAKAYTNIMSYYQYGIIDALKEIDSTNMFYYSAQNLINKCERLKEHYESIQKEKKD